MSPSSCSPQPVAVKDWSATSDIPCKGCGVPVQAGGKIHGVRYCYLCAPMMEVSLNAAHASCVSRAIKRARDVVGAAKTPEASKLATLIMQFAAFALDHPDEAEAFLSLWRRK